ncbi:hypothetical protein [Streptomyces sp. NBC_01549]|uniref:hypothetical protein n=1 Tax=Streptomyces sp. NBC_01549 TaxID=2975874 RepID=UPI00338EDF61
MAPDARGPTSSSSPRRPGCRCCFMEADNCTEDASVIAAKFDKYMRHYRRKVKDTDGLDKPMWRAGPRPIPGGATRRTRRSCSSSTRSASGPR